MIRPEPTLGFKTIEEEERRRVVCGIKVKQLVPESKKFIID